MAVTTERLPRSLVAIEIEVDQDRVEASIDKAVRRVAQQVRIKGFRPGKAPRAVVEREVGRPALLQEALDELIPEVYSEAIEAEAIEPIDQPEIDLDSMEPLVVKAKVPVRPTVDVTDFRTLRVPKPDVEAGSDDVEQALTNLRRRFATLEPVDRAVEWDDTVRTDVSLQVDGQDEHQEEDAEFRVDRDGTVSLPGFLERVVGLERGAEQQFSFTLPEDFEAQDLAGKEVHYSVTVHEVKREVLPDLDDEFARSLDEGFDTEQELREHVEADVKLHAEQTALATYHEEIIGSLLASAELDYPEVLVEREIDRLVDELSNHASHTPEGLEEWLTQIGRSEEELRDSLRDESDLNVRRALVITEIARVDELEASDARIDERLDELIDEMLGEGGDEDARGRLRELLDTDAARSQLKSQLTTTVVLEHLVELCSQPDEEAAGPARGSRRRRSRRAGDGSDDSTAEATLDQPDETDGEDESGETESDETQSSRDE